jgi:hypothetical protein
MHLIRGLATCGIRSKSTKSANAVSHLFAKFFQQGDALGVSDCPQGIVDGHLRSLDAGLHPEEASQIGVGLFLGRRNGHGYGIEMGFSHGHDLN